MKLQIAMDLTYQKRALEIADEIHDIIDIYEVGTPLIMKEGCSTIRFLKEKYPKMCVLADSKIVDGGAIEAKDLCEAGADIVTVLALADNATVTEVVETAHAYKRKVLADLICVKDIPARSRELKQLGVDYIGVHTGVDMQKEGRTPLKDLKELVSCIPNQMCAVAGGVKLETLDDYVALNPEIIIAGSALYAKEDVRKAVLEVKEHLTK